MISTAAHRRLGRLLAVLEGPPCDCYREWEKVPVDGVSTIRWLGEACPHVKAALHGTTLADWAVMLLLYAAKLYAPRPPPLPMKLKTREGRIAIMMARRLRGESLFHKDDELERERQAAQEWAGGTEVLVLDREEARPWHKKR